MKCRCERAGSTSDVDGDVVIYKRALEGFVCSVWVEEDSILVGEHTGDGCMYEMDVVGCTKSCKVDKRLLFASNAGYYRRKHAAVDGLRGV